MKTFIKAAAIALVATVSAGAASATTYWVKDSIHLNARSGPSASTYKVGTFNPCTKVHVVDYKHGWAKVVYKHKAYWVSAKYLQVHSCGYHAPAKKKHYKTYKSY